MAAPTPARFKNEIDPLGAKSVHKTCVVGRGGEG
jgi:hypothetical protein